MKTHLSILLFTLLLIASSDAFAQDYESVSAGIDNVGKSAIAWGDYDNDGDLDLVISGYSSGNNYITRICRNDEGEFTSLDEGLIGLGNSSVNWGDFDNDGDLDILISGQNDTSAFTKIYANELGSFLELDITLPGVQDGEAIWGDYDNDGDLDILITGSWITKIYRNDNAEFVDSEIELPALQSSSATWGDYDNDGDLDILIIGDTGGGFFTYIFRNDDGDFVNIETSIEGLFAGTVKWVDFDNDGDLDISMTGFDMYLEAQFKLFRNVEHSSFEIFDTGIEGICLSSVDWGDYDNDGDLDILMCGKINSCGGTLSCIYRNDSAYFTKNSGANFDGSTRSAAGWADYDNDGDLDALVSGLNTNEIPKTTLYRNTEGANSYSLNTAPEAPSSLHSEVLGGSVLLSWDRAMDAQTQQEALSYNLRISQESGMSDYMSPMSLISTGQRLIQQVGNVNQCTQWEIGNLTVGTYYWSVQTIDQAYTGSAFAEEQNFTVIATGIDKLQEDGLISISPNPVQHHIQLSARTAGNLNILNLAGQSVYQQPVPKGNSSIDLSILEFILFTSMWQEV